MQNPQSSNQTMVKRWESLVLIMNKEDHEDIILWPDGVWCYRYELEDMSHKSDDYQIIEYGTEEHERISMV